VISLIDADKAYSITFIINGTASEAILPWNSFILLVEELGNVNDLDSNGIIKGELNTLEFID
jgi:hypothetical protein